MTGKAGRARHSRHAVVCTVCALLLSTSGTVFGLHRYNAQLRNDCAAAVSAAGQAVNDYMSAVSGTDTALKNARDTDGYRTSDGAAELISQVSDVNRQVRVDLTCTDREQLRTLRSTTSDLNTAKDALNSHPSVLLFPAGALALTVLGFIMLGDVVRDALDPKARK